MGVLCNQYLERIILSLQILFRKSIPTLWLWWVTTSPLSRCCLKFLGKGQSERLPLAWGPGASPGGRLPISKQARLSSVQTGRIRRFLKQGSQCVVMKHVFKNPNCSRPKAEAQPSGNQASAAPVTAKHRLQVSRYIHSSGPRPADNAGPQTDSESPGGLFTADCWAHPQGFWFSRPGVGPRFYISCKFTGDADAAGQGIILRTAECSEWLGFQFSQLLPPATTYVVKGIFH